MGCVDGLCWVCCSVLLLGCTVDCSVLLGCAGGVLYVRPVMCVLYICTLTSASRHDRAKCRQRRNSSPAIPLSRTRLAGVSDGQGDTKDDDDNKGLRGQRDTRLSSIGSIPRVRQYAHTHTRTHTHTHCFWFSDMQTREHQPHQVRQKPTQHTQWRRPTEGMPDASPEPSVHQTV
jgi:hypothetical protein